MKIQSFYDQNTATYTYIVIDDQTNRCAIIDPVLDYDQFAGRIFYNSISKVFDFIKEHNLKIDWILETHIHADHFTAATHIKKNIGGKIAIGEHVKQVLDFWVPIFNSDIDPDAKCFDHLLKDGEIIKIGNLEARVIHTPGHTPACVSYLIEDHLFVGDTIFMPYVGTARADFPGGSAKDLYLSIQKIFNLVDDTKIHVGHDYPLEKEKPQSTSTVAIQKAKNVMISKNTTLEDFVAIRNKADANKSVPKLLIPALQFNLRAGALGQPEQNGLYYIKIPIN